MGRQLAPSANSRVPQRYAFVHMENKEDALQAIEALHGTSFKGRPLSVELSKVQPSKQGPTGKIPCVSCGKQGHYAGECPLTKPSLEQYQSQAAVVAAAAAAAAGLPLQVQQSVHNSVYNTPVFDPTYAALSGLSAAIGSDGNPVSPAVYGALASQVYGTVANQLYSTPTSQALTTGASQVYSPVANPAYSQVANNTAAAAAVAAAAAAAAAYSGQVYPPGVGPYMSNPAGETPAASAAVTPAYSVAPALYSAGGGVSVYGAVAGSDPTAQAIFEAARAHYFAQGQQVLAEQQAGSASSKSGDRDRSPVRRSGPLLPDPLPKPYLYQRPKRRALLPTPTSRPEDAVATEEDPFARYYAEYYQQYQSQYQSQYQYPPQYQYPYPYPSPAAVPAVPAVPAPSSSPLEAQQLAAPRAYEPPQPPPRKEPLLRRPDLPPQHTPEPPFR